MSVFHSLPDRKSHKGNGQEGANLKPGPFENRSEREARREPEKEEERDSHRGWSFSAHRFSRVFEKRVRSPAIAVKSEATAAARGAYWDRC